MAGIQVRAATVDDSYGISRVRIAGWRAAYRGLVSDVYLDGLSVDDEARMRAADFGNRVEQGHRAFVAVAQGDVVGFAYAGPPRDDDVDASMWEVYAIYADPAMKRQGIGRALMRAAVDSAPDDVTEVLLWAFVRNTGAHAFYESLGFADEGIRKLDALDAADGGKAEEMRFRAPLPLLRQRLGRDVAAG